MLKVLLLEIKSAAEQAKERGKVAMDEPRRTDFETRYDHLIINGLAANPLPPETLVKQRRRKKRSKAKNLLDLPQGHKREVLALMDDFKVPFDNNLAERDLRMVKAFHSTLRSLNRKPSYQDEQLRAIYIGGCPRPRPLLCNAHRGG